MSDDADEVRDRAPKAGVLINWAPAMLRRIDRVWREREFTSRTQFVRDAVRVAVEAAEAHQAMRRGLRGLPPSTEMDRAAVPRVGSSLSDRPLRDAFSTPEPSPPPPPPPTAPLWPAAPTSITLVTPDATTAKVDLLYAYMAGSTGELDAIARGQIVEQMIRAVPDETARVAIAKALDERLSAPPPPAPEPLPPPEVLPRDLEAIMRVVFGAAPKETP